MTSIITDVPFWKMPVSACTEQVGKQGVPHHRHTRTTRFLCLVFRFAGRCWSVAVAGVARVGAAGLESSDPSWWEHVDSCVTT